MDSLKENIKRIHELTESLSSIPFRETINGTTIKDASNGKKAVMNYIYKDDDCAITIVDIEGNFLHQCHFHQEYEVIVLLKGQLIRIYDDKEEEQLPYVPIIIKPMEEHTMYYPKQSKVLAITIPASRHFPNHE